MTTQTPDSKPRALIAMSGGVDSSVAAWLMQQAGYDCTGITMRLTRNETLGQSGFHTCCSEKDTSSHKRAGVRDISEYQESYSFCSGGRDA